MLAVSLPPAIAALISSLVAGNSARIRVSRSARFSFPPRIRRSYRAGHCGTFGALAGARGYKPAALFPTRGFVSSPAHPVATLVSAHSEPPSFDAQSNTGACSDADKTNPLCSETNNDNR